MARPKPDPAIVAAALELVDADCSHADAAEAAGVTAGTIRQWLKRRRVAPAPVAVPDHMAPAPDVPVVPLTFTDPIALVRQLIAEQHAAIQTDRGSGNTRGAASNAATLERLVKSLKQMEAHAVADADKIVISTAELAQAEAMIEARIAALAVRGPIRCAECSRELSVAWGTEGLAAPSDTDPGAAAKAR